VSSGVALALMAAQPVPVVLLSALMTAAGAPHTPESALVGGVLPTALVDLLLPPRVPPSARVLTEVLARLPALAGVVYGLLVSATTPAATGAWTTAAVLTLAGAVALLLRGDPRLAPHLPVSGVLTGTVAGVSALALAGSLARLGGVADLLASGLVLATVAGAGALFLVAARRASRARWRRRHGAPGTR
jgi:hypothetical protein